MIQQLKIYLLVTKLQLHRKKENVMKIAGLIYSTRTTLSTPKNATYTHLTILKNGEQQLKLVYHF